MIQKKKGYNLCLHIFIHTKTSRIWNDYIDVTESNIKLQCKGENTHVAETDDTEAGAGAGVGAGAGAGVGLWKA